MIIVSRYRIIFFLVFNIFFLLVLGICGYLCLTGRMGGVVSDGQIAGEILLIMSSAAGVLSVVFAVYMLRTGKDAIRDLQRTIHQYQQLSTDFDDTSKIGKTGQELLGLYRTLIEYNRKRTMKINSLSLLTRYLVNMSAKAVGVLDSAGHVIYKNSSFPADRDKSGMVRIGELFPELNFQQMLHGFFEHSDIAEYKLDGTNYYFIPIFAMHDALSYVVVTDDQKVTTLERGFPEKRMTSRRRSIFDKFRQLFSFR